VRFAAPAVGVLLIALPASAAAVDPHALVLRQADVPGRFSVDSRASEVTSNACYSSHGLRKLVARTGRITGYRRVFRVGRSRIEVIQSQVDLFRRPDGARSFLAWWMPSSAGTTLDAV
jgi:hypothetical protein